MPEGASSVLTGQVSIRPICLSAITELTFLLVVDLARCVGGIASLLSSQLPPTYTTQTHKPQESTHQHLLILANPNTLPLNHLQVLQTAQHLMVHLEDNLDPERSALLDGERLILETLESAGGGEVDEDIGAAFDFQGEGLDDAFAGVVGVADGFAAVQAQGGFPAVEGFVVLVCWCIILVSVYMLGRCRLSLYVDRCHRMYPVRRGAG